MIVFIMAKGNQQSHRSGTENHVQAEVSDESSSASSSAKEKTDHNIHHNSQTSSRGNGRLSHSTWANKGVAVGSTPTRRTVGDYIRSPGYVSQSQEEPHHFASLDLRLLQRVLLLGRRRLFLLIVFLLCHQKAL